VSRLSPRTPVVLLLGCISSALGIVTWMQVMFVPCTPMCSREPSDFGGRELVNMRSSRLCHILRALSIVSSLKMASSLRVHPVQLPSPGEFLQDTMCMVQTPSHTKSDRSTTSRLEGPDDRSRFPPPAALAIFTFHTAMGVRIDVLKAQLWPTSKVLP
jgi:hypothetical protein